jgi:hypothetical protein
VSLRVESTLITRPSQSPEEVALEAIQAAMLARLVPVDFAVVREQSTAGVLAMTEGMNAVAGTNIAYSRMWTNSNVSPSRTGVLFKPNGPLATAKPDYPLLLGRLNKP